MQILGLKSILGQVKKFGKFGQFCPQVLAQVLEIIISVPLPNSCELVYCIV
jgi:hypothetical protein